MWLFVLSVRIDIRTFLAVCAFIHSLFVNKGTRKLVSDLKEMRSRLVITQNKVAYLLYSLVLPYVIVRQTSESLMHSTCSLCLIPSKNQGNPEV